MRLDFVHVSLGFNLRTKGSRRAGSLATDRRNRVRCRLIMACKASCRDWGPSMWVGSSCPSSLSIGASPRASVSALTCSVRVTPTGAPVRDAGDQIAATTSTGSPRGATAQNPCVLPWRPTVTSRFIPYATSHSCSCATGSAETLGLCQGCSEQVAAITAAGQDPDDDYPWVFVDDDTHSPEDFHDDRHNVA